MDQVRATIIIGEQTIYIRAREAKIGTGTTARNRARQAREATVEIRKDTIKIARPKMPLAICQHP